jgi:putative FmdB family regulatory protein
MPIYAYKCSACGFAKDVLQKMSDPVLTECPNCQAAAFSKQLTSAGFQLKGSGWYATDFKGGVRLRPRPPLAIRLLRLLRPVLRRLARPKPHLPSLNPPPQLQPRVAVAPDVPATVNLPYRKLLCLLKNTY